MCGKGKECDCRLPYGYNYKIGANGEVWTCEDDDTHVDEGLTYHIGEKPMSLQEWMKFVGEKPTKTPYKMGDEVFDILVSDVLERCKNTLSRKAGEYAKGSRLSNFHKAGQMCGRSPEKALLGFMLKHEVSLRDIVDDLDKGVMPSDELLNEKIGDILCYHVLLLALITERKRNTNEE